MNKIFRNGVLWSTLVVLIGLSCKKKDDDTAVPEQTTTVSTDENPPTLILNGEAYVKIPRNSSFDDPWAFATDDVDGNISSQIEVFSDLDSSKFGLYNLIYTVSDKAGNYAEPVVRNVEVVFGRSDFYGNYNVTADPNCPATVQLNSPQEIRAGINSDEITFVDVLPLIGGDLPAKVNGRRVTLIETTLQSVLTISGSGEMNEDGNTLIMNITIVNTLPIIGSTENCTFTYTRI